MAASTPISGLADEPIAPVTAPGEEVGNPRAVAALAVAAVTVAAPPSVLAVAVAAFGTAPVIPDARVALHDVCVVGEWIGGRGRRPTGVARGYLTFFLEDWDKGDFRQCP